MLAATDEQLAKALKVLGHPARVGLLRLLAKPERFACNLVDPKAVGVCVNDLAKEAGLPQSTASHHLGLMQEAGLVVVTQHGAWRYIRADQRAFQQLAEGLRGLAP